MRGLPFKSALPDSVVGQRRRLISAPKPCECGEVGGSQLPVKQPLKRLVGSTPTTHTVCPRSSTGQSIRLRIGRLEIRILPRALCQQNTQQFVRSAGPRSCLATEPSRWTPSTEMFLSDSGVTNAPAVGLGPMRPKGHTTTMSTPSCVAVWMLAAGSRSQNALAVCIV